jgi:hypothetical protein
MKEISKNEDKQIQKMVTYFSLCAHLRDYIEENVSTSKFNFNKVKMITNQLAKELEKSIDIVFDAKEFSEEDKSDMLENFVQSTRFMEYYFRKGLQVQSIDPLLVEEISNKINEIFKSYGINE